VVDGAVVESVGDTAVVDGVVVGSVGAVGVVDGVVDVVAIESAGASAVSSSPPHDATRVRATAETTRRRVSSDEPICTAQTIAALASFGGAGFRDVFSAPA
jgi:hypothetical protein